MSEPRSEKVEGRTPLGVGGMIRHRVRRQLPGASRSEEHTSELQSLMRISYAVFCLKKKQTQIQHYTNLMYKTAEQIEVQWTANNNKPSHQSICHQHTTDINKPQ